jgi:hypothetical protein
VCYTVGGGMAEWTIAAVLKTAGLTAPGVRIPLPPPEGKEALFHITTSCIGDTGGIAPLIHLLAWRSAKAVYHQEVPGYTCIGVYL